MTKAKKYWKGLAELTNDPAIESLKHNEFAEKLPVDEFLGDEKLSDSSTSRRDFLKFLGFSHRLGEGAQELVDKIQGLKWIK